jgi:hypothetical protein
LEPDDLLGASNHLDSTSTSVCGEYEEGSPTAIKLTQGFSKKDIKVLKFETNELLSLYLKEILLLGCNDEWNLVHGLSEIEVIIGDPRCPFMRDRINKAVKNRESFRPFAPSVKLEMSHRYFENNQDRELPHMLFTAQVREEYKKALPAITHVDESGRIQKVNKDTNPLYWQLINELEKKSGIPILLNTSFNVKGQPMVCSPEDVVKTPELLRKDVIG